MTGVADQASGIRQQHEVARLPHIQKLAWLMPRMLRAVSYLGDVVVGGREPERNTYQR